ncbi:MAG: flagellar hook-associated protein 3 [Planctomycetia bacterium 21-64-5]|nr:MAG: flagellar hook-associated protein 3 [Planctomycetia bacterium 21-64-5]HQU41434.1 flagellar hook-associated protein FlgL [Pirellulales bacterium]
MNIIPVPSSRISDTYVQQQLLEQMQQQQQNLSKLQQEISSGSQLTLPSDNPSAALQAVGLQSLLAQNQQYSTNLSTNSSSLSASDSALSQVNTLLDNVQGIALGAVGSTATAGTRQSAVSQVQDTMNQILSLGNTIFNGRYLFAGSEAGAQPYALTSAGVEYNGNNANLSSYADTGNLFTTNVTGNSALGGFSSDIGSANLAPVLTAATPLTDLNGGSGVTPGSISISDGSQTSVVDLSSAATVGDVVKMIEAHPPAGRTVTVDVTNTGLSVSLDAAGGGPLSIADVGGGKTAADLGIAGTLLNSPGPLVGTNLNPTLSLQTPLGNILGTQASTTIASAGPNNDLTVQADTNGPQANGVNVVYVNDAWYQAAPGITAGNEFATYSPTATPAMASLKLSGPNADLLLTATTPGTAYNNVAVNIVNGGAMGDNASASYDATNKTLTLTVDGSGQTSIDSAIAAVNSTGVFTATRDASAEPNTSGGFVLPADIHNNAGNTYLTGTDPNTLAVHIQSGASTANDVINAINKTATFNASLSISELGNDGTGVVSDALTDPSASGTLSGGSGVAFDQNSGIQIVNGGKTYTVSFAGDKTVEDLLNSINTSGASVLAAINPAGTGINVQSRLSGSDFSIGENGGQTATELGIRTLTSTTPLADLNYGQGVGHTTGGDFTVQRKDGVTFTVDISSAKTLGDVINLINNNATNTGSGVPVLAQLNSYGNGIELVDNDPSSTAALSVSAVSPSTAAKDLGLVPANSATSNPPTAGALAAATVVGTGANNDLVFQAAGSGTALNGVTVQFANTGAAPGSETVNYDSTAHTLTFDVGPATTANAIISTLANDPVAGKLFAASLAPTDGGAANDGTGIIDPTATGTLAGGTPDTLSGADTNPQEVPGIFTALERLQTALQNNDVPGIQRATTLLTNAQQNLSDVRAALGANEQAVSSLQSQVQTEQTQLQGALSNNVDVNMAQAISDLVSQQTAFQASLQVTGLISKLTLINYL